jgi:hypothetical protein|uniref:Uncharacterized protein n=1 Tax=viral metagenome TaxID=1070528 RepID=A0A6C0C3M7_9ZZZZ
MISRLRNEAIIDGWDKLGIQRFAFNTIYIPVKNLYEDKDELLVVDCKSYPFKGPQITYKGHDLLIYYRNILSNPVTLDSLQRIGVKDGCICCNSLLCGNNWNVTCTIKNLLDEFNNFKDIYKRSVEIYWSSRISNRYLVEDIALYQYL